MSRLKGTRAAAASQNRQEPERRSDGVESMWGVYPLWIFMPWAKTMGAARYAS
jgi:hypothetical protein